MFRNGLSAGRRSVRVSTCIPIPAASSQIGRAASTPLSFKPEIPFICLSCQVRSYAKPRKTKSPLEESIKRLEKHVQFLETRYRDHVKQEAVKAETPSIEITDEMQDEAYAALMASESQVNTFLPSPSSILPKLPKSITARLGTSLALIKSQETLQWEPVLQELQANGGFKKLKIEDVNKTIILVPITQRANSTDTLLSMIETSEISPNVATYDLLMMANAARGNVEVVQNLFRRLKEAKMVPNVRIYGHILKAYSFTRDVASASAAFQEMHALGIKPNLIVYTSLIKTCINREELDTAWQIFDLIKYRSSETAPDVSTYSLMIHACAMRGEAEKALDLFRHMVDTRGLEPDEQVYDSLIHACAVRKDYFLDAWKYAIEMRDKGMRVARRTLNHLLQACGKNGDLTRARLLMRLMMSSRSPEFQPDERSFQGLLRAYATAKWNPGLRKKAVPQEAFLLPNSKANNKAGSGLGEQEVEGLPFLQGTVLTTRKEILSEARQLLHYIIEYRPWLYSTKILNAYLDVCYVQYGNRELRKVYLVYYSPLDPDKEAEFDDEFDFPPPKTEPDNSPDPTPEVDNSPDPSTDQSPDPASAVKMLKYRPRRNIHTFEIALEYARKSGAIKFARKVWADRMAYCLTQEYWGLFLSVRQRLDFTAEKLMVQTLAKAGNLREALDRLKILQYEYDWTKEDLKPVYDKAREMDDIEAVMEIRSILKLDDRRW
ncbi:hypothetical protein L211DRAFT_836234 [Terfezia boudieri ATCC MYA-4762]|uniref:PROP1-like PPR domain-containing protein n=1 Tax=Terfezia boudieri ATCC MYA-4762 TaxID=1051890 RepID=A0A3N4LXY3_9PEZI|nr:hypothetical protein L211DRAFT_836234 [Terfezia boudieri ATCC MYA-4762]